MTEEGILEVYAEEVQNPRAPTQEEFYKKRTMPLSWLKEHKNLVNEHNIYLVVYSPNNTVCAMTYLTYPVAAIEQSNLSIVDTKTNQELHNICLHQNGSDESKEKHFKEKYFQHLAISSSGNIFATTYIKQINENIGFQIFMKIQNLCTQKKERPNYQCPDDDEIIAFNKQGTHLIVHGSTWDSCTHARIPQHTIIPLTTTLDNHMPPKKTFIHYCAQKMICKNIMLQ